MCKLSACKSLQFDVSQAQEAFIPLPVSYNALSISPITKEDSVYTYACKYGEMIAADASE